MTERALATIRRISDIQPIENADKISVATVDGWQVVIANEVGHKIGDLVIFYEIDSLLPERPEFEFLRKSCYVQNTVNGSGFRLKTVKLRKQISQGLVMPVHHIYEDGTVLIINRTGNTSFFKEGDDVTEFLGVKKYEKPLSPQLSGEAKGWFPSFIPKTDAERIQNCFRDFENKWKNHTFEATIKLDGTSATYYKKDGEFGVCSRNLELKESEGNLYWKIARQYDIERYLPDGFAIQGEIIGPGIQGNHEKLTDHEFFVFNVWNIEKQEYLNTFDRE